MLPLRTIRFIGSLASRPNDQMLNYLTLDDLSLDDLRLDDLRLDDQRLNNQGLTHVHP